MIDDEFTTDTVSGILRGCNCAECLAGDDQWCCRACHDAAIGISWPTGHANDCTCRRCYIAAMGGGL